MSLETSVQANAVLPFRPVPVVSLRVDTRLDFDVYIQTVVEQPPVLYREKNLIFTTQALDRLVEHKREQIFIPMTQDREYRKYVESHLETILGDPGVTVAAKSEVVYATAQSLVAEVLKEPRSHELLMRSRNVVSATTKFLTSEHTAFQHLLPLVSYDYYTYTHSVNVFVFSMSLAQRVGITDQKVLEEFGEGALLHDIGKSQIDPAIVNCRGKLNDEQWKQMRKHPVYGYELLSDHAKLGELALHVVRHHHEKIQGGGYPDGLLGKKIPPLVRISTIADIFDALTTRRSYKPALESYKALQLMRDEMSKDIDPEYFRVFVEMMGNPAGTG